MPDILILLIIFIMGTQFGVAFASSIIVHNPYTLKFMMQQTEG